MGIDLEYGAVLPHNEIGTDVGAIKAYLQGVEELGFTHLLAYDHVLGADRSRHAGFSGPYDKDVSFHEPLTFFAFAAGVTTSLDLVSTVLILPQRQAALVAKQAAEVAILSDNRLRLGVGTGWNTVEYEALGVPFERRGTLLDEHLAAWEGLWGETPSSFEGEHYAYEDAYFEPKAWRPDGPRIWLGGQSVHPRLLHRIVRHAHGFHPLGQPSDEDLELLRDGLASAGRSLEELELVGGMSGSCRRATPSGGDSSGTSTTALSSA